MIWRKKAILVTQRRQVDHSCEARFWLVGVARHSPVCPHSLYKLTWIEYQCKCRRLVYDLGFTCPQCNRDINIPLIETPEIPGEEYGQPNRKEIEPVVGIYLDYQNPEKMTLYGTYFSCNPCGNVYSLENGYLNYVVNLKSLEGV